MVVAVEAEGEDEEGITQKLYNMGENVLICNIVWTMFYFAMSELCINL